MKKDWSYISKKFGDSEITVKSVQIDSDGIEINGSFDLPPLAKLSIEDQVFVAVFVKSHGSIKEMEKHFKISYPTVKSRLNRVAEKLSFVNVETKISESDDIINQLERGELDVEAALERLNKGGKK